VQFPTGGKVREHSNVPIRCDSGTDSTVWMEEDTHMIAFFISRPEFLSGRIFYREVTNMD